MPLHHRDATYFGADRVGRSEQPCVRTTRSLVRRLAPLLLVCVLGGAMSLTAQLPELGPEIQVNTFAPGDQDQPDITTLLNGDVVVVWTSAFQDGDQAGVFARRFTADGAPLDGEVPVNALTAGPQQRPAVTADGTGGFVVAWDVSGSVEGQPFGQVHVTRLDALGQRVWETPAGPLLGGVRAEDADIWVYSNDVLQLVWTATEESTGSRFVEARRLLGNGSPNTPIIVATQDGRQGYGARLFGSLMGYQEENPLGPAGDTWLAWDRFVGAGTGFGGGVLATEPATDPDPVAVTGTRDANIQLYSWGTDAPGTEDLDGKAVLARLRFSAPFQVNTGTAGDQVNPSVAILPDGRFLVAWQSDVSQGTDVDGTSVQARLYDRSRSALTPEIQVNTTTVGDQHSPRVTAVEDGFVVTWASASSAGDDTSGDSVQLRKFSVPSVTGRGSWWQLERNNRDAILDNDGNFFQQSTYRRGACGSGLSMRGLADDPVRIADDPTLDFGTGDLSIAAWVEIDPTSEIDTILDKRQVLPLRGYHLFLADGRPGIQLANSALFLNYIADTRVDDGRPHSIVVSVDRDAADGVRIYIDGVLDRTFSALLVPGSIDSPSPLFLGRRSDSAGADARFRGVLDEVQLFPRALTAADVAVLHDQCRFVFANGFGSGDTAGWASSQP